MECLEEYGERHRAIRKGSAEMSKQDLGDLLDKIRRVNQEGGTRRIQAPPKDEARGHQIQGAAGLQVPIRLIEGGKEIEIEWVQE
jgi:hypothetical protein